MSTYTYKTYKTEYIPSEKNWVKGKGNNIPPNIKTATGFQDDDKIQWLAREISGLTLAEIKELKVLLREEYRLTIELRSC